MMTGDEAMEKLRAYEMSDEECGRANELTQAFFVKLRAEFGPRAGIIAANLCASHLSHMLTDDPDEARFVRITVNVHLANAAKKHGGDLFHLDRVDRVDLEVVPF